MLDNKETSQFAFYEIVNVYSKPIHSKSSFIEKAMIAGKAQNEDGIWSYCVNTYVEGYGYGYGTGYCVESNQLESTGQFDDPKNHVPVGSIRVSVNEQGEGYCKDYPNAGFVEDLDDE